MNNHRGTVVVFSFSVLLLFGCTEQRGTQDAVESGEVAEENVAALAACLRENGWVMYSSFTCSACRAQRKAFGDSFALLTEVECNPHAPDAQVDRCVEKKILKTPTWIQEKGGIETDRLTGHQELGVLAEKAQCALPAEVE